MEFRISKAASFCPPGMDPRDAAAAMVGVDREEFDKLVEKIFITILHRPSYGVNAGYITATDMWTVFGTPHATVEDQWGGIMDITRANMVSMFMNYASEHPEIEYLCMMDDDETMPWEAPYLLARWGKPVVSGVVCSWHPIRGIYANFMLYDANKKPRFPSVNVTGKMPHRGLITDNVYGCGSGLILIHKDVFAAILKDGDYPFRIPEAIRLECLQSGVLKQSEDFAFSAQCRSRSIPLAVDLSVKAAHFKTVPIMWPDALLDKVVDPLKWTVDPGDYAHGE